MIWMTWFSICDLSSWWWLLLWWLLPFLLGLFLGWLLWAHFKQKYLDLESKFQQSEADREDLLAKLRVCRDSREQLQQDILHLREKLAKTEELLERSKSADDTSTPTTSTRSTAQQFAATAPTAIPSEEQNNLQIIEGIGPAMEKVLHENGIKTWADLAQTSPDQLRSILEKYGAKYKIIDPTTWPQQAALAAEGKWDELIALQKSLGITSQDAVQESKVEKWLVKIGLRKQYKQDDLKAIEGIGPKIEKLLIEAGITTWRQLAQTPVSKIREILESAGPNYALADPSTWPQQAALAAEGKWDELTALQEQLRGGRRV